MKVEDFINLKQGNISVEEYSLKLTRLSRYDPYLVFNLRNKRSRFLNGVSDLVKKECRMAMLQDDMTLSRHMVYAQSIEESTLNRINRNLKMSRPSEKNQHRFKKRAQN